jgi:hypothetical protein
MFPLPTLGPELTRLTHDLIDGRGVVLIRGVPVDRYGKERASSIYWGIGMHLGQPWPQNAKGHLLGDVTDQGKAVNDPTSRGNEIGGVRFPFHSDGSDLVGLFCLDPGARGGASLAANAVAVHNELVRTDPELALSCTNRSSTTCEVWRRRPAPRPGTRCRSSQPLRRPVVRALHPSVHRSVPAPRRRPGSPKRHAAMTRSTSCVPIRLPRRDDDAARRHAVRQQLPRCTRRSYEDDARPVASAI